MKTYCVVLQMRRRVHWLSLICSPVTRWKVAEATIQLSQLMKNQSEWVKAHSSCSTVSSISNCPSSERAEASQTQHEAPDATATTSTSRLRQLVRFRQQQELGRVGPERRCHHFTGLSRWRSIKKDCSRCRRSARVDARVWLWARLQQQRLQFVGQRRRPTHGTYM